MQSHAWLYAAAGFNVALALFHLGFWRLFRWREELPKLHPVNRGVMQALNLMLLDELKSGPKATVARLEEIGSSRLSPAARTNRRRPCSRTSSASRACRPAGCRV